MASDYALVHLKYTLPPALVLTFLYRPLQTRLDAYKTLFLILIAVVSATPWDSYLIRHKIWTYPPHAILGPTVFSIPLEEVFFFVIQTYNTSLLYLLLSKPTLHPLYLVGSTPGANRDSKNVSRLRSSRHAELRVYRLAGTVVFGFLTVTGALMIWCGGKLTYMGLILVWAGPFLTLLWTLAYQFIIGLPLSNTITPVAIPTFYLWMVDTWALRRGTWVIESGTKLGWHLWNGLELEEAVFFLATNMLVVFGLVAFDNALAILQAFPSLYPDMPINILPSPVMLVTALLKDEKDFDEDRIVGLQEAVKRLKKKSRSFYFASSVFEGRLRIDLILLYSFCRAADDLVDNATSADEARHWITKLSEYLRLAYAVNGREIYGQLELVVADFPAPTRSALRLLPTDVLPRAPLCSLLDGFVMDLQWFPDANASTLETECPCDIGSAGRIAGKAWPIETEADLHRYAGHVAGTVAELCLALVFHHLPAARGVQEREYARRGALVAAATQMGEALQYVNIARDIGADARVGRVYIPAVWLADAGLQPTDVHRLCTAAGAPGSPEDADLDAGRARALSTVQLRLLDLADALHTRTRGAIADVPDRRVRGALRVAVESYMEIGRLLRWRTVTGQAETERVRVSLARRAWIGWCALRRDQ